MRRARWSVAIEEKEEITSARSSRATDKNPEKKKTALFLLFFCFSFYPTFSFFSFCPPSFREGLEDRRRRQRRRREKKNRYSCCRRCRRQAATFSSHSFGSASSFFSLSFSSAPLLFVSRPLKGTKKKKTQTIIPSTFAPSTHPQATVAGLALPSTPVSLTVAANKSLPAWPLHGWALPTKNTTISTLGALGRGVGSVANSTNPLNATKTVAKGLELYKKETEALIFGKAGIVSIVNSVNTSSGSSIRCFVDPKTGQLIGLEQAGVTACSTTTGDVVDIPASAGYISQIKLAYTYDGAFVGRLVFDLKASATAKPVSFTCGSAGGKAVDLLPSKKGNFVVTKLGVGCAPLPTVAGSTGVSAKNVAVSAAALASLPIDPVTGVPETPKLGDVIGGGSTPTPGPPPSPPPPPPPPAAPIVTPSSATLLTTSTTLVITGFNFDPVAGNNVVTLSNGAVGIVSSASATSLTITFSTPPSAGSLTAVVTSFGVSSGAAVQVATVVAPAWSLVGNAGFSAGEFLFCFSREEEREREKDFKKTHYLSFSTSSSSLHSFPHRRRRGGIRVPRSRLDWNALCRLPGRWQRLQSDGSEICRRDRLDSGWNSWFLRR